LKIENLENRVILLNCDRATAKIYGTIKNVLRKNGTPIPENDIWIASVAKQYGIKIITRDNHFDKLQGIIDFEKW
jgi:tRNA(fMet)-specific endonuclease VapC